MRAVVVRTVAVRAVEVRVLEVRVGVRGERGEVRDNKRETRGERCMGSE